MDKLKAQLNVRCYKSIGFYVSVAAAICAAIGAGIYGGGFSKPTLAEFYSPLTVWLLALGICGFAVLEVFNVTAEFAPIALWGCAFAAFLNFAGTVYMYFPGIFYNGVTAEAFGLIDPAVLLSAVFILISCIAGNVAIWLKQTANTQEGGEQND